MITTRTRLVSALAVQWFLLWPLLAASQTMAPVTVEQVRAGFQAPPDDARAMMRWWWFGPAVSKPELKREIAAMRAGGFGGFEIQPVYPLSLDDPNTGLRNLTYLSDEFIDAVRFAAQEGRVQGLRVDMTLGSGWPFGGPHVPVTQAASQIRMEKLLLAPGEVSLPTPRVGPGEKLLAAFIGDGGLDSIQTKTLKQLPMPTGPRVQIDANSTTERTVLFFLQSRTGQQVKRPGIGGEGFVLDHMSRAAIDNHLGAVGDRLMQAFGEQPPAAVFSDSLEVYRADWTDDLLDEFKRRRGYDLLPFLPALFLETDERAAGVRHDWGQTLSELVDERYLMPANDWAKKHRTKFRSQTYGFPPVTLSSNALVALPEGEGHEWRAFSTTRWATSASHLFDRQVTSAEAFTWLHSPSFRATPLDMKAEADVLFLQGINQLIGHGWPYTPPGVAEPGWSLYAAAVFSDQNPWWIAMPDISRYLQRVSYVLRQGRPANDVAILLPTNDAWAATKPGRATVSDEVKNFVTPALTAQLLDAGYGFDYIDAASLDKASRYRVLVLPNLSRIDVIAYQKVEQFARLGGVVLVVGKPPALAAGHRSADVMAMQIEATTQRLLRTRARTRVVAENELGAALRKLLAPDLLLDRQQPAVGFIRRKLENADIYFVANTTNQSVTAEARFREGRNRPAQLWNPMTGATMTLAGEEVTLKLAPYESTVVVFGAKAGRESSPNRSRTVIADISNDWQVEFAPLQLQRTENKLTSWTDDAKTRYYSGVASYKRAFEVAKLDARFVLSLGEGMPVPFDEKQRGGRAWLESPVREAAEVYVNGQRAGSIWAPPYELDITRYVRGGSNNIELRVGNLAINTLAGRTAPDYRLLNLRFGERFQPQDMENLQPLPAGLIGASPITVLAERPSH
ncbi:MAG TPA: glycosyl hydrolase [Steroidobacter sp.]|uniref:glycosyl hydrolase n=1 Tax=Steroidobacter sp. TaxID=1978227 RepID=UPI002ED7EFD4